RISKRAKAGSGPRARLADCPESRGKLSHAPRLLLLPSSNAANAGDGEHPRPRPEHRREAAEIPGRVQPCDFSKTHQTSEEGSRHRRPGADSRLRALDAQPRGLEIR